MKIYLFLIIIFVNSILYSMEENEDNAHDSLEHHEHGIKYNEQAISDLELKIMKFLINKAETEVIRKIEKDKKNGIKIYKYFLVVRNKEGLLEAYFSRKLPKKNESDTKNQESSFYGKFMYTMGERNLEDRSEMINYVLHGNDARLGYYALRKKYRFQKKDDYKK